MFLSVKYRAEKRLLEQRLAKEDSQGGRCEPPFHPSADYKWNVPKAMAFNGKTDLCRLENPVPLAWVIRDLSESSREVSRRISRERIRVGVRRARATLI